MKVKKDVFISIISNASDRYLSYNGGVYTLILKAEKGNRIRVGRRKIVDVVPGYYIYVGSALKNLAYRLNRYIALTREDRRKHWHIDYILASQSVFLCSIVYAFTQHKVEPTVALALIGKGFKVVREGIGSSEYHWKGYSHFLKAPSQASFNKILSSLKEVFLSIGLKPYYVIFPDTMVSCL